ncbi:hypothetical protein BATDEDRAFT_92540 [Batrachochytrium dendrobatidis JAM81]|uniref:Dynein regulatory complex protein 10 n=2 Tax=Batrachochytrium dendrobatidis TaxID=109871 RepID=F4PE25_BATDJ|nr:uncharacterized protein BATDEDRAFT_92540 [Batrachochytrium dendrobatidis JAM81]EGF76581.1 hypothetical protein BATDEDRAFT_92540 [Batrachochytrium dendrobatidis JAM81]|eukprot:XP_006682919.1 hypothetical protein BATDEDRAFT_92540 [Batrachochytrium dendrobatidis JAM81]
MNTTLPPLPSRPNSKVANEYNSDELPTPALMHGVTASTGNTIPIPKAQAYIAIFEDALDQLAVLGDITPEAFKTDNKQISEKITRILFEQRALQERYQELLFEQDQQRTQSNKPKLKEIQTTIADVFSQLQASLARHLKAHPSVAQNLLKIQQERTAFQSLLFRLIHELRDSRFDSLIFTVEEEYKKRNALQHTINRENDASDMLKELQRDLGNEKKLIQDEITDRNQVIQQLKDTIQEINTLTASEQKYIKKEVKAHENSVRLQCQEKESELVEEKMLLRKRLNQERLAHQKIVEFLNHQRNALEKEIQEWMIRYEEDTEAKSVELEALKQKRSQDLDRFEELVVAYEALEKIVDEDKLVRAKEIEEQKRQQTYTAACVKIQRWFRKRKQLRTQQTAAKAPVKQAKAAKAKSKGKKK